MPSFQKIILYSACAVLVVALVFIGVAMYYAKYNIQWPPIVPECPDYWTVDGSGNNVTCINEKDLGTCPAASVNDSHLIMDFHTPTFMGSQGTCAKYTWAKRCGLSWDGITYGVTNPCQQLASTNN